mmetsp:Transcript_24547/g.77620  ORF Transcript_24547/g.77620 Transcript_24547/m.77620 type:complete len:235 (-) Transcript_24547:3591-4295(-)
MAHRNGRILSGMAHRNGRILSGMAHRNGRIDGGIDGRVRLIDEGTNRELGCHRELTAAVALGIGIVVRVPPSQILSAQLLRNKPPLQLILNVLLPPLLGRPSEPRCVHAESVVQCHLGAHRPEGCGHEVGQTDPQVGHAPPVGDAMPDRHEEAARKDFVDGQDDGEDYSRGDHRVPRRLLRECIAIKSPRPGLDHFFVAQREVLALARHPCRGGQGIAGCEDRYCPPLGGHIAG